MKQELLQFLRVRESSQAKRVKVEYRKGFFTIVRPEGVDIDKEEVVEEYREWFEDMLPKACEYRESVPDRCFEEGSEIQVLGVDKCIVVERCRTGQVSDNVYLAEHLVERSGVKDRLEVVLRRYARSVFEEKVDKFSQKIDGDFNKIFVRDQGTRWGSCSSKNNLNFNWRLILGPEHVLDYVVVHELVHLEELNHSKRFWKRVEEIYPSYERSSRWLSENSAKLVFDTSKF